METDVYRVNSHPLHDPSTFWGGLANHKKVAAESPADRFQTRPVTPSTGGNTGMVEGALPGQTGLIFHFRAYLPISGEATEEDSWRWV